MSHSGSRYSGIDFPFYTGEPVFLKGWQWIFVLAGVAVAFWLLVSPWSRPPGALGMWVPAMLFCTVPLIALASVAGRGWTALFRPMHRRDVALMLGIAVLNIVVTMAIGLVVTSRLHASPNPVFQWMADGNVYTRVMHFAVMVPQLLGEELLTILPLLACLWLLHTRWGLGRRISLLLAWILSAVPFALVHLPTYDWNLIQCLLLIGSARLILSLGYLMSRNVWVSTGAHVLNDWALIGIGLIAGTSAS